MTDPIADILIRVKNAGMRKKPFCRAPFSKIKFEIVKLMEKEGLISGFKVKGKNIKKTIEIFLAYKKNEPIVKEVKRISKPGRRIYAGWKDLSKFGRKGVMFLSTPMGIMTTKEAKRKKIGGEVLFKINP